MGCYNFCLAFGDMQLKIIMFLNLYKLLISAKTNGKLPVV
jgi:hypothetical protein